MVAGSAHSGVYVRAKELKNLEKLFEQKGWHFEKADDGLKVAGVKTDEVGVAAFHAGVPLLELTSKGASLEEALLELTADSQEYHAHTEAKK